MRVGGALVGTVGSVAYRNVLYHVEAQAEGVRMVWSDGCHDVGALRGLRGGGAEGRHLLPVKVYLGFACVCTLIPPFLPAGLQVSHSLSIT